MACPRCTGAQRACASAGRIPADVSPLRLADVGCAGHRGCTARSLTSRSPRNRAEVGGELFGGSRQQTVNTAGPSAAIEKLAQERFSKSVKKLNKLEASGLIEELLEKYGDGKGNGRARFPGSRYQQKEGGR